MEFIKTFESFINESSNTNLATLKTACKGAKIIGPEPGLLGDKPSGVKKWEGYSIIYPGLNRELSFSVVIYDDAYFEFYWDSTPVPTILHSRSQAREMGGYLNGFPMPLADLTPEVWASVITWIKRASR